MDSASVADSERRVLHHVSVPYMNDPYCRRIMKKEEWACFVNTLTRWCHFFVHVGLLEIDIRLKVSRGRQGSYSP